MELRVAVIAHEIAVVQIVRIGTGNVDAEQMRNLWPA
jgi:hypothetical protein